MGLTGPVFWFFVIGHPVTSLVEACCDDSNPSQGAWLTAAAHPSDTAGKPEAKRGEARSTFTPGAHEDILYISGSHWDPLTNLELPKRVLEHDFSSPHGGYRMGFHLFQILWVSLSHS